MTVTKGQFRIERIRARDGDKCCHCGEAIDFGLCDADHPRSASVEHIIPKARGGSNLLANLALAHRVCNISRGDKRITQEAKVVTDGIFCHDCFEPLPDQDAVTYHRLAVHGFLSMRYAERVDAR